MKGAVGKAIGNQQMQAEGKVKELKGKAENETAKGSERLKGKVEAVVGGLQSRLGGAIDNAQMQAEGKAKQLNGQARQAGNK